MKLSLSVRSNLKQQITRLDEHGKRSAQSCGMEAEGPRRRLGLRQPVPEGHGLTPVVGTEGNTTLRGFFNGNDRR